jgi:hypothetical protein
MAFEIALPWRVDDAALYQNNVDEDPFPDWSNVHYLVGQVVIFQPNHNIYSCVLAHSNKSPGDPAHIGVYWVLITATNRWRAFDYSSANNVNSRTVGEGKPIVYRIKAPAKADTVAMLMASGSTCAVDVIRNENALSGGTGSQRNILPYAEEQSVWWAKTNMTVTEETVQDPWEAGATAMATGFPQVMNEGTATGLHYIESTAIMIANATQYTFSFFAELGTGTRQLMLAPNPAFFSASPKAFFNLSSGTVASTSGGATATITATTVGWYRCTITATSTAAGTGWGLRAHMTSGATESYAGTSSTIRVCGAMCNTGGTAGSYQWTRELPGGAASIYGSRVFRQSRTLSDIGFIEDGGGIFSDAIFTGVGALASDYIGTTIYTGASNQAVCSEIVFGFSYLLGDLLAPFSATILDFSRKDRNEFGNVTLIPRGSADQQSYTVLHDLSRRQYIKRVMKEVSARAVLWYDDTDLSNQKGQATLGFWTEYSDDVSQSPVVMASITVESMS